MGSFHLKHSANDKLDSLAWHFIRLPFLKLNLELVVAVALLTFGIDRERVQLWYESGRNLAFLVWVTTHELWTVRISYFNLGKCFRSNRSQ
jgi:hypothetical protein